MQNRLLFFSILLILAVVASAQDKLPDTETCGKLNAEYLYNRKSITEPDEFPWMGRIAYQKKSELEMEYTCLAVLISTRYMLTNAHCLNDDNLPHAVVLGDWDTANNVSESDCDDDGQCAPVPQIFDIEEIVINPNYNRGLFAHDIAMLRLNGTVTFSDHIRPICLPGKELAEQDFVTLHLELTGWFSPLYEAEKKQIKYFVHMMSLKACEGIYGRLGSFNSASHLCAITSREGAIYLGGSALMDVKILDAVPAYYYLVGLDSYGSSRFTPVHPDIFFRVDAYLDWIKDNVY